MHLPASCSALLSLCAAAALCCCCPLLVMGPASTGRFCTPAHSPAHPACCSMQDAATAQTAAATARSRSALLEKAWSAALEVRGHAWAMQGRGAAVAPLVGLVHCLKQPF